MRPCQSKFSSGLLAVGILLGARNARAQACCAGSGAVTPARLGLHDWALLGSTVRASGIFGSFDPYGAFVPTPSSAREYDFEQDIFGAVRVLRRGQLAAMVPMVETYRQEGPLSEGGGGVGDINLAARYDLVRAGESRYVPGIGLLAGVTLPTGKPPDASSQPLATDATGLGTTQGSAGVALEQAYGPFLVSLSGVLSLRAPQSIKGVGTALAPQVTMLASGVYAFSQGATVGLSASYAVEGDAEVNGAAAADSGRRLLQASLLGSWPFSDQLRALGTVFFNPPVPDASANQNAAFGVTLGVSYSFL